jgi:hypothetical protein
MVYPYHVGFGREVGGIQEIFHDKENELVHITSEGQIMGEYFIDI